MPMALRMRWGDVLFQHWAVSPDAVRPLVPPDLEIDCFDGDAWVSVIAFVNRGLRPAGVPSAIGVRLPEINVRTYVRHKGTGGIYFFSLDADGVLPVLAARLTHHLPYYYARIDHERDGDHATIASSRRHPGARHATYEATYAAADNPRSAAADARDRFLCERYRFYTGGRDGSLRYTDVAHQPWIVSSATVTVERDTMLEAIGLARPRGPALSMVSAGVDVRVAPNRRVRSTGRAGGQSTLLI